MIEQFNKLTNVINEMWHQDYFPGASYSLVNKDKYMCGCVGNKSLIPIVENNSVDTLYDMASLTKVIVTNTILTRALEQNRLSLMDDISIYLPQYKDLHITIYDIVTHSSGLPADFDIPHIHSNEDFIKQLNDMHKEYTTGTNVVYSDRGFVLLGMILEKVYGKTLDKIATEEVFIPLHMDSSTYHPSAQKCAPTEYTKERGLVRGRTHDEKAYYSNNILGHAGLFSTVEDISKFAKMVLNNGLVDNKQYISKKYLDLWFMPCKKGSDGITRSIGWIVGKNNNVTGYNVSNNTISHTGFTGTSIVIDRDNDIAVVALTNRVHPTRDNRKLITERHLLVDEVIDKQLTLNNNNVKI